MLPHAPPARSPSTSTSSASTRAAWAGARPIDCGVDATELYGVDADHRDAPRTRRRCSTSARQYVDDCAEKYPDLLPHLGTRDVARDMDSVRAAMGDEQLSYLGFSYGTAIGQVYADLFPDRVRSMVLDGVARARAHRARAGRRAGRRVRDGARSLRRVLRRGRGLRDRRRGARGRRRGARPGRRSPAGSRRPTPTGPPGPGEANLGISYALYSESLWGQLDERPRRRPRRRRQRAGRAGRRLHRHRRLRDLLRRQLHRLRLADRRPGRVLRGRQGDRRDVTPLRRGARQRLHPLRRLAGAAHAARAHHARPARRRSS